MLRVGLHICKQDGVEWGPDWCVCEFADRLHPSGGEGQYESAKAAMARAWGVHEAACGCTYMCGAKARCVAAE